MTLAPLDVITIGRSSVDLYRPQMGGWGEGVATFTAVVVTGTHFVRPAAAVAQRIVAHAAVAYAKALRRRRMMACTTSIGPGATNLVTAAAVAHVNRLPLLLIPGDAFANRRPDPVLQQVEDFGDGTVSVNDCLRPVSRYFDSLTRPEQVMPAFARAMAVLTDPAECGPVTLAFCQDVQAEACDFPARFFEPRVWIPRRPPPDKVELAEVSERAEVREARERYETARREQDA
jgi:3D-(3,5/4)-trihydroxycyclohexane-1,2-dione acylhydrolase (decyclizing)